MGFWCGNCCSGIVIGYQCGYDVVWFGQLVGIGFIFGQWVIDWVDYLCIVLVQQGDVGLGSWMQLYLVVYCWVDCQWCGVGQVQGVDQVIGMVLGQLCQQIGGIWCDYDVVGLVCQFDVVYGLFGGVVLQCGVGWLFGQGLEVEWSDELLGIGGYCYLYLGIGIVQVLYQFQGFVGCDFVFDV